jgi:hypothetical protein
MVLTVCTPGGESYQCPEMENALALKQYLERECGYAIDAQTLYVASDEEALSETASLNGVTEVVLVVDKVVVRVRVGNDTYEVHCQSEDTVEDVRRRLETLGVTGLCFATTVADVSAGIGIDGAVSLSRKAEEFVASPLRMCRISYTDPPVRVSPMRMWAARCDGTPLILKSPWMRTSSGIQARRGRFQEQDSFHLVVHEGDVPHCRREAESFLALIKQFERRVVDDAVLHSHEWFVSSRVLTRTEVEEKLHFAQVCPILDVGDGQPTLFVRVPCHNGDWGCDAFDGDANEMVTGDLSGIVRGTFDVRVKMECGRFMAKVFGFGWGYSWILRHVEFRRVPTDEGRRVPPARAAKRARVA